MRLAPALWRRPARRRRRLLLEWLEDRTLLSGSTLAAATLLAFDPFGTAHAAAFLSDLHAADLYRVHLGAGDRITAAVSAQASGSGLVSLLRVFDASGNQLALDD